MKKVTVVTASTGRMDLMACMRSVRNQTYTNIEHLVVLDGPEAAARVRNIFSTERMTHQTITLPYAVGTDRWNGHRIYAAGTFLADGDYVCFLDDDNTFEPHHVESLMKVLETNDWAYSFRSLVDANGHDLGHDDCESLGKWPSVCGPDDYFVDVNCFMLPKMLAVYIAPLWYRKFREPGQAEVDRVLTQALRTLTKSYDSNYQYTVNYKVGNGALSVQPEFFKNGNAEMLRRYDGQLPWVKT